MKKYSWLIGDLLPRYLAVLTIKLVMAIASHRFGKMESRPVYIEALSVLWHYNLLQLTGGRVHRLDSGVCIKFWPLLRCEDNLNHQRST